MSSEVRHISSVSKISSDARILLRAFRIAGPIWRYFLGFAVGVAVAHAEILTEEIAQVFFWFALAVGLAVIASGRWLKWRLAEGLEPFLSRDESPDMFDLTATSKYVLWVRK